MKKYRFKHMLQADIDLGADFYIELRGEKSLAVYGCRGIAEYTPEHIALHLYGRLLTVEGVGLMCDSYTNGAVLISGQVVSLEISEAN